jgi:hypothetical protein
VARHVILKRPLSPIGTAVVVRFPEPAADCGRLLRPRGDAGRDRIVAARISLRSEERVDWIRKG